MELNDIVELNKNKNINCRSNILIAIIKLKSLSILFTLNSMYLNKPIHRVNLLAYFLFHQFQIFNFNLVSCKSFNSHYFKYSYLNFFLLNYFNSNYFFNLFQKEFVLSYELKNKLDRISNYNVNYLAIYNSNYIRGLKWKLFSLRYFKRYFQDNFFFMRFFISRFLQSYFNNQNLLIKFQRVYLMYRNISKYYFRVYFYKTLLKRVRFLKFFKDLKIKFKVLLHVLLLSLYYKDIVLLKNFIKHTMERLPLRLHRRLLFSLRTMFKLLSRFIFFKFNCTGIFFKVKGKIGVGGNSKKRAFIIKYKKYSFSSKNQKLVYVKDSIHTYVGALGLEIYLSYL